LLKILIDLFLIAFPQSISTIFDEDKIENEQNDENNIQIPDSYHMMENLHDNIYRYDDHSSLTFATTLNLRYRRNLFQLSKHSQSIVSFPEKHNY
jgi:hypothetical protein